MPGSWFLYLLRFGVPSVETCVAFKKQLYDPKGSRFSVWEMNVVGSMSLREAYLSGPSTASVVFSQVFNV